MGFLIFVLFGVPLAGAYDASPTLLEGDWIRVVDGCEDLPDAEVARLNETGGGNTMSRGQRLSFRGNTFVADMFAPSRCARDYEAHGPDIQPAEKECRGGKNSGEMRIVSPERFEVIALNFDAYNPWGSLMTEFDFKLFPNDVLYVRLVNPDVACAGALKRIYFIRAPMS